MLLYADAFVDTQQGSDTASARMIYLTVQTLVQMPWESDRHEAACAGSHCGSRVPDPREQLLQTKQADGILNIF